jgi:AmmeMemoRadiSam system protein B
MNKITQTRPSPIAGHWYSGTSHILRAEIINFLNKVTLPDLEGKVIGVMAPHAGYRYSGQTAAYAFQSVRGRKFDLVIILSPFHAYHPAKILTSAHEYYQTPLGKIPVDRVLVEALLTRKIEELELKIVQIANDEEHSLEIELPFLQCALEGDFSIIPLMVRNIDPRQSETFAGYLYELIKDRNVLIVASTDLSHFHPQFVAERLDQEMLDQIRTFSIQNVYQTELKGEGYACGLGAVMISMSLCKMLGANQVEILHYSTSGKETGDFTSVVGYGAGVFVKSDS